MQESPKTCRTATSKSPSGRARGRDGEERALSFLTSHGLALVERNFHCRGGEIDLILREGDEIVFVEVRVRAKGSFGGAAASVTASKRARLILAAQIFLQRFRTLPACRFDVLAIDDGQITWLKNVIES